MRFPECLTLWVSDKYFKDYDTISQPKDAKYFMLQTNKQEEQQQFLHHKTKKETKQVKPMFTYRIYHPS